MIQTPISVKRGITAIVTALLIYTVYIWLNPENWVAMQALSIKVWFAYAVMNITLIYLLAKIWKGKNWAKWLLFIFFLINLAFTLIRIVFDAQFSVDNLVDISTVLIETLGWFLLFNRESNLWFQSNKALTRHSSGTTFGSPLI